MEGRGRGSALLMGEGRAWILRRGGRLLEKGRKGREQRLRAANHLYSRWGVGRARGTYGCRPSTQPGEHITKAMRNFAVKGTS